MKKPGRNDATPAATGARKPAEAEGSDKAGQVVSSAIGRQLRTMYDHVLQEPVPDRFLDLIAQLDEAGESASPPPGDDTGK